MAQNVKFISVKLQATYDALITKDSLALYWIQDTQRLYKGDKLYGIGIAATAEFAGLMSPEDKKALDALVAAGNGLASLTAVDGTMNIVDTDDGGKAIGVAIAPVENNLLIAVDGGLFVPTVVVPEYAIEKVATEDGYSASYKLKKTAGDDISYVGDTINIAKDLVLQSATLETVTEDGVPYEGAKVGDPYIKMVFNNEDASNLYIPVKGLVDTYTAGSGIEIIDNKISVKIATDSHGLVAVDGALTLNLATRKSDGAMSAKDKVVVDSIPHAYVARKYDISGTPEGTLVDYRDHEIRIMVPQGAEFKKQSVGTGGDANTYYMTFKTCCPNNDVVGYVETINGKADDNILTDLKTDEFGRKYQPTWLGLASFNESTNAWSYYGTSSSVDKMIGWDYRIDWYNSENKVIATDSVRINLSNESCHNINKPYYMTNYATSEELDAVKESIADMGEFYTWAEM